MYVCISFHILFSTIISSFKILNITPLLSFIFCLCVKKEKQSKNFTAQSNNLFLFYCTYDNKYGLNLSLIHWTRPLLPSAFSLRQIPVKTRGALSNSDALALAFPPPQINKSIVSLCNGRRDGSEISPDKYEDRCFYCMAHWHRQDDGYYVPPRWEGISAEEVWGEGDTVKADGW